MTMWWLLAKAAMIVLPELLAAIREGKIKSATKSSVAAGLRARFTRKEPKKEDPK